jgi:hypothetical protein
MTFEPSNRSASIVIHSASVHQQSSPLRIAARCILSIVRLMPVMPAADPLPIASCGQYTHAHTDAHAK